VRLVEVMVNHPPVCLHCGKGNTDDEPRLPSLDLEREVNWGDSTYLCGRCVMIAAALYEYISPGQYQDMQDEIDSKARQIHELRAELDVKSRRISAILEGKKAVQAERTDRSKKAVA
jgi:hypothetical protein